MKTFDMVQEIRLIFKEYSARDVLNDSFNIGFIFDDFIEFSDSLLPPLGLK